jgi:predicted SAM-dependent methyltransferase
VAAPLVFAADTLVRFRSGRILIHTTSSTLPAFDCDNPMMVGWLCQFAKPTAPDQVIALLQPQDRTAAAGVLEYLLKSGALIEAGSPAAQPPPDDAQTMNLVTNHLRLLARSLYDTACDLLGLGPHAERQLAQRTGVGIERRMMSLLAATDALRVELRALRQPYLQSQCSALGLTEDARELKLHIGCGKGLLDGWVNIDVYPAPLAMNVLWGLPFADGSAHCVFVSHLLEHLFYPRDVQPFLKEVRRVLAPGGVLRVVVPDIEQCIEAYVNNDPSFFASRRETWPWWPENPTRLEDFLGYAGAGAEPAWLFESHKYGYDFETLSKVLIEAGFRSVVRSGYMMSTREELRVDHASAVASAKYGDRHYSLFVEAKNPG